MSTFTGFEVSCNKETFTIQYVISAEKKQKRARGVERYEFLGLCVFIFSMEQRLANSTKEQNRKKSNVHR